MIIELKTSMAEMCWPECNICNHFVHGLQMIGREENHLFIGTVSLSYLLTDRLHPPSLSHFNSIMGTPELPRTTWVPLSSSRHTLPFRPPRKARCFFFHPNYCFHTFSSLFGLFLFLSPSSPAMISPHISPLEF
jgi:hypothetical protein